MSVDCICALAQHDTQFGQTHVLQCQCYEAVVQRCQQLEARLAKKEKDWERLREHLKIDSKSSSDHEAGCALNALEKMREIEGE